MTAEQIRRLAVLSRQLTESLMHAALCANEITELAQASATIPRPHATGRNGHQRNGKAPPHPFVDEATLSVTWRGKTLHLGHIKGFWLLARLARRANQYVTHADLLPEIWDDELADTELVRAGMKRLRGKLRRGGMADLAEALTGHHGRYMLDLARTESPTEVPRMSHRPSRR